MPRPPRYGKGFQIDREKIAKLYHLNGPDDPKVNTYINCAVRLLNRSGYLYLDCGLKHDGSRGVVMIIVLADGYDKEEVKNKDLGVIDETIEWARPHVLTGPDVWELN